MAQRVGWQINIEFGATQLPRTNWIKKKPQIHFLVHGRVQGVFFRNFTQKEASKLGITGWCSNTDNEKVVGEAQGSPEAIKKFLEAINRGPPHARVVKLDKEDRDLIEGENQFEVRR
ncbi:Acylphosphatase-like domain-containing protein [Nemania sp. NC0429]|nr:Acylphosphatase-like domain-containing protein [Nemania sp. NC0429]